MIGFHFYVVPVLVAAVVQFLIGWIWYGVVFKKRYAALTGNAGAMGSGRTAFAMICSFVGHVILCFVLANLLVGRVDFVSGAALAIVCWLGFMAPPLFSQHIYENRPVNLFAINAGYWVVAMAVAGGVLAVWPK